VIELAPLFTSALVLGLLGGGHCLGMCGGLMGALTLAIPKHDGRGEKHRHPAQDHMQFGAEVDIEFRPGGHGRHHRLEPQQAG
jgi:hypothetical protein